MRCFGKDSKGSSGPKRKVDKGLFICSFKSFLLSLPGVLFFSATSHLHLPMLTHHTSIVSNEVMKGPHEDSCFCI